MLLEASSPKPIIKVDHLVKHFPIKNGIFQKKSYVKAVNNISFYINEGETYGLVGESGCGKSTTGRMLLRLIEPTSGDIYFQGQNIAHYGENELRKIRKDLQIVFQDPYSSLNPRTRIGKAIEEPIKIFRLMDKKERKNRVYELLEKVGLQRDHYDKYPHEFSGGQRQRIVLARALAVNPKFIVCDEPVSALDVSIQSQILNLLLSLQEEFKLTYLFISHDLSVVRHISDRIGVMYLGYLVEESPTDEFFREPLHPYSQALLSAVPHPNPKRNKIRIVLKGDVPSPLDLPKGCVFHPRCPVAKSICKEKMPVLKEISNNHKVACHLY